MEESEYSRMVQQHSDMVYRIAFSYVKNREDAEDIYQNVFLKLFNKKSFTDGEHAKRWLIRVTINECNSLYRSPWKKRRQECEDWNVLLEEQQAENDLELGQAVSEGLEEVTDLLNTLPEKYNIVLYLYFYEEYSTKEIAGILRRKESTIRTHLMRGKDLLRKKMEERGIGNE
ncbi:MAG: RNA polymerase sigma factor [Lachnospiraceae bacterium]